MTKKTALLLTMLLALSSTAFADIEILDPWVRASTAPNTALYVKIVNTSPTVDKLINVTTNDSMCSELHAHEEDDGVMKMTKVGFIAIPPHGNINLESGGNHIMLIKLHRPLQAGNSIQATFHFEKVGAVEHAIPVRAM